eukprot:TRINITY_DN23894_c0_g1_i1.p1 TRINITY_DN23894_c0_g1~~TRINITY_DN23894_c0_g1_i1.p1  ORF type:complete len:342 (+),score=72.80 TRINITY_DN23894_c0_g1_i1:39-1028(+)
MKPFELAKALINDIKSLHFTVVTPISTGPQAKVKHDKPVLNDISQRRWGKLKHVEPVVKDLIEELGQDRNSIHIKQIDRKAFLKDVESGIELKSVKTIDKTKPIIDTKTHIKQTSDHSDLLKEMSSFSTENLKHVETTDKSIPHIPDDLQLPTMKQPIFSNLTTTLKTSLQIPQRFISAAGGFIKNKFEFINNHMPQTEAPSLNQIRNYLMQKLRGFANHMPTLTGDGSFKPTQFVTDSIVYFYEKISQLRSYFFGKPKRTYRSIHLEMPTVNEDIYMYEYQEDQSLLAEEEGNKVTDYKSTSVTSKSTPVDVSVNPPVPSGIVTGGDQ